MANVERIEQELAKAEKKLDEAKAELKTFNEGEDRQWLAELKRKLRRGEGTAAERGEWKVEKTQLEEWQKSLEDRKEEHLKQVEELQQALITATTQPGNDFITWALGT